MGALLASYTIFTRFNHIPTNNFHCSMQRIFFMLLVASLFAIPSSAQKREFRAAWIATVSNIDWPSRPGLPAIEQQQQFIRRLEQLERMGCNAVIVQIRPAADAFYASKLEPWSRYLTGKQGQPPFPYYDPLQFMIEEAHKRNIEFHAWFNPFRALVDSRKNPNPPDHITYKHPDWIISYGGKSYINPGIPEAREYVINVITDVVKRYDIDAVHLDDYFYPYRIANLAFNDAASHHNFNMGIENREDWRRNNVTQFVTNLNTNIKAIKPYVKFGISPFGVWRNASKDPEGSRTRGGQTNYDDLYSDIRLWLEKGWIDYALPQLYWEHNHRAAPFEVLLPWWRDHAYDRHVYYGLGLYRMLNAPTGIWGSTRELLSQIKDIRTQTSNSGYALYSLSNLDKIYQPIGDSLAAYGRQIAFPPVMKWLDSIPPAAPTAVKAIPSSQGTLVQWQEHNPHKETLRFAIYRFRKGESPDLEDAANIIGLTSKTEFLDATANTGGPYFYIVTALDRVWNESKGVQVAVHGN
jgi:uncharacterized lipoprotein YddW (UPF0748 family)